MAAAILLRLPTFSGHPISADLLFAREDVHCESEVSQVLFLGIYPILYYFPRLILFPQRVFNLDRGSVPQALVEPCLVPP